MTDRKNTSCTNKRRGHCLLSLVRGGHNMMILTVVVFIVIAVAVLMAVVTATLAVQMRSKVDVLDKQILMVDDASTIDSRGSAFHSQTVKGYALVLRASQSLELNARYRPRFRVSQTRVCGVGAFSAPVVRRVTYVNPTWMVLDGTRSAQNFFRDVVAGVTTYIIFKGHVCRVRPPTEDEEQHLKVGGMLPGYAQGRVRAVVVCDDMDVSTDAPCDFQYVHPFPRPGTEWKSVFPRLAASEKNAVVAHVWGYTL